MEQTQKPDMGEVIKSILQAEERAAEIAEQAAAECKGIIAEAEAKAAAIKAEAEEDVKEKLRQESVYSVSVPFCSSSVSKSTLVRSKSLPSR